MRRQELINEHKMKFSFFSHEINEHIYEFYKSLYSAHGANVSMQNMFACDGLECPTTWNDSETDSVKRTNIGSETNKKGKSPGPDGISNEFYTGP